VIGNKLFRRRFSRHNPEITHSKCKYSKYNEIPGNVIINTAVTPPMGPTTFRTSGMNEARRTESENHPTASSRALAVQ